MINKEKPAIFHTFGDVEEKYFSYISKEEDRALIKRAYQFADEKHAGILRKSGEPYIHHLIEVMVETSATTSPHKQNPLPSHRVVTPQRGNDVLSTTFCKEYIYISPTTTCW